MTKTLLPCPFCGSAPQCNMHEELEDWAVFCIDKNCGVRPCSEAFETEAEAVFAWNRRAAAPEARRALSEERIQEIAGHYAAKIPAQAVAHAYIEDAIKQALTESAK